MDTQQKIRAILGAFNPEGSYKYLSPGEIDRATAQLIELVEESYKRGFNDNARDCYCGDSQLPHRHLKDDGKSHRIQPDIKEIST